MKLPDFDKAMAYLEAKHGSRFVTCPYCGGDSWDVFTDPKNPEYIGYNSSYFIGLNREPVEPDKQLSPDGESILTVFIMVYCSSCGGIRNLSKQFIEDCAQKADGIEITPTYKITIEAQEDEADGVHESTIST